MKFKPVTAITLVTIFYYGCLTDVKEKNTQPESGTLTQVSVIDAIAQGIYDGTFPVGRLTDLGNLGIGTFQGLEGEMVILNDTVFQVLASGDVVKPQPENLTPFAAVTEFAADTSFSLSTFVYDSLKTNFNDYSPSLNLFYAIKINGDFDYVKARSVPGQTRPYPSLVEVTRQQTEFEFNSVRGDIVGFFVPEYAKGVNVTGLHLHFLTSDRTGGGHIIEFKMKRGTLEIGYLTDYHLILPETGDFFTGDFTIDRSTDLEEAEN